MLFVTVTTSDLFSRPSVLTIIPSWAEQLWFTHPSEQPLFHRVSHIVTQLIKLSASVRFAEAANKLPHCTWSLLPTKHLMLGDVGDPSIFQVKLQDHQPASLTS